jgi:hypothetical protein
MSDIEDVTLRGRRLFRLMPIVPLNVPLNVSWNVPLAGIEPATIRLEGGCSIR